MSTLNISERITLDASPDVVWTLLVDPRRMVACLPGAEITGQDDDRTYLGALKVKVGAVTIAYRGKIVFEEIDDSARYIRAVGKGREKSGSGSVTMTMESRVIPRDGGGCDVTIDSEVRLTGRVVRFGRGMIDTISAEIFKDFRVRLAEMIREEAMGDSAGATDPASAPAVEREVAVEGPSGTASAPAPESDGVEALRLIPLLLRALRSWLGRIFGRG